MNVRMMIRLTAPVVATSLLLLTVAAGAAWHVHSLERSISEDIHTNVSSVRAAEEVVIAIREIRTQLDHYLLHGNRRHLDGIEASLPETNRWLSEAQRWSSTAKERELTKRARLGYDRFCACLAVAVNHAPGFALPSLVRALINDLLIPEVQEPTQNYLDLNEVEVENATARNQVFADRLAYILLLLGTCGSGAGMLAGFALARGFTRSLIQLSVPIRDVAGRLDEVVGPVTFTGGDFKQMESGLRQIADRIGAIIDRLHQSEREVLRAEQFAAAGQMAAGMAHELRNPLTSMKILVQAAQASDDAVLRGRDLVVLEEEIRRLERLVHTFLQFARPPQPEKAVRDVQKLVKDVLELTAVQAARVGTELASVMPSAPSLAEVDADQVRQVLLNLVLNALDAQAEGGVIRVEVVNGPDNWITVQVEDTGPGLPAALGSRIFTPFVTTKQTGLGLGLSISKRIVEAHGGEITGANRPSGGAVFTVRLPRKPG